LILMTSFKKKPAGFTGISVARWQPKGYRLPVLKLLAPVDRFGEKLTGFKSSSDYRKIYRAALLERKEAVRSWLATLSPKVDLAFCCWCNLEQQRLKGYQTIMCHTILLGMTIRKYRPDILVFLDWDRYRYSIWKHNLPAFDPAKYKQDQKRNARRLI